MDFCFGVTCWDQSIEMLELHLCDSAWWKSILGDDVVDWLKISSFPLCDWLYEACFFQDPQELLFLQLIILPYSIFCLFVSFAVKESLKNAFVKKVKEWTWGLLCSTTIHLHWQYISDKQPLTRYILWRVLVFFFFLQVLISSPPVSTWLSETFFFLNFNPYM